MEIIETKELSQQQKHEILTIWNTEYPLKLGYNSIDKFEEYLFNLTNSTHYLAMKEHSVVGWLSVFERENEIWFVMIIDSEQQGRGLGSKLLAIAKEKNLKLNGWVIDHDSDQKPDGTTYRSPVKFYTKNGFTIFSEERLELEIISAVKINWAMND